MWTISEDHTKETRVKQNRMNAFAGSQSQSSSRTALTQAARDSPRSITSIQAPPVISEVPNIFEIAADIYKVPATVDAKTVSYDKVSKKYWVRLRSLQTLQSLP